ncbi:MAG: glycosyltransferase [Hungatella sp.]|nr:glycosyltransferase [Hungatella sp.]
MSNKRVAAVVVTYNRKELFQECINSILEQKYECESIIAVDNKSNDGTNRIIIDLMETYPKISGVFLDKNTGGAGGFYAGMIEAIKGDFDYIWIMDDDTIPTNNCLEKLIEAANVLNNDFSYLASSVIGLQNEPMNVPQLLMGEKSNGYSDVIRFLGDGLMEIGEATFVSLLIKTDAVKKVGLPWPDFFLWGDDSEYTYRLTHYYGKAYVVGSSIAIHKRAVSTGLSIFEEPNPNRIDLYYYFYRNSLIRTWAYGGMKSFIKRLGRSNIDAWKCIFKHGCRERIKKFSVIYKAIFDFLFGRYDKHSFDNRFHVVNGGLNK